LYTVNYRCRPAANTAARSPACIYRQRVNDLHATNALLTGAAGGLGGHIARALATRGVRIAASGRRIEPLERLCRDLRRAGAVAEPVIADLSDREQTAGLVERAEAIVGPLDLLISNAGLEPPGAYTAFTDAELLEVAGVNLLAPMVLTRHALPGMLARGRGHIVMISSLAGRGGNAFNIPYATTKAGLIGCARSLRAELEGSPVSASVICPGFIANDGMYADIQREFGVNAPIALRPVHPNRVADAVVQAITGDRPDILITGWPMRPLLAIQELAPRVAERLIVATGAPTFFRTVAELTGRGLAPDTSKNANHNTRPYTQNKQPPSAAPTRENTQTRTRTGQTPRRSGHERPT
jgi:short-subunit dehydrogenase